ncbi:MAG: NACHT domain-containing protein [Prochlorotrichaceae cyanobacterium]
MMTEDKLRSILAPFTDQDTELVIRTASAHFDIKMIASGEARHYIYNQNDSTITDRVKNRPYTDINSLLASDNFSDLEKMAAVQARVLGKKFSDDPLLSRVTIETDLPDIPRNIELGKNFSSFLNSLVRPILESEKIKILLIDGPAGIGKTYFIERLAFEHAEKYLKREKFPPILHASSRGRRLSRFNDVIAATIQDFRSEGKFYYQQVPVLVRQKLLYLALDGFDELVDSDGYKNAWDLLSNFLEQIDHGGLCILAGRDTFFDKRDFLNRLNSNNNLEVVQIHLSEVPADKAANWLLQKETWKQKECEVKKILEVDPYFLRPYFLTELSNLNEEDYKNILSQYTAKDFLINKFIEREASLIMDTINIPLEQTKEKTSELLREVALDMSEREADYVDFEYLSMLCEYIFDDIPDKKSIQKLQHRIRTLAFLEKSDYSINQREFPHESIQHYFASLAIIHEFLIHGRIPTVLRRGILGTNFLEIFADVFTKKTNIEDDNAKEFITSLMNKVLSESSGDRFSQNATSLLLSTLFREPFPEDFTLSLSGLYADEVYLAGIISTGMTKANLDNLTIGRCNGKDADLTDINFSNCTISDFVANDRSKFGITTPNILKLSLDEESRKITSDPTEITEWLRLHSDNQDGNLDDNEYKSSSLYKAYERICRLALKGYLYPKTDVAAHRLYNSQEWKIIEPILKKFNLIEEERTAEVHKIRIIKPSLLLTSPPNTPPYEEVREEIKCLAASV